MFVQSGFINICYVKVLLLTHYLFKRFGLNTVLYNQISSYKLGITIALILMKVGIKQKYPNSTDIFR